MKCKTVKLKTVN